MGRTDSYRNHLQILEQEELEQLYGLPDFDPGDRPAFFTLTPQEYNVMQNYRGASSQVFFVLLLGYFKARHQFFIFDFERRPVDTAFVLRQYFPDIDQKDLITVSRPTRSDQQQGICGLFRYRPFNDAIRQEVYRHASTLAKRHNHAVYLFRSLLHYLHNRKIILPAYSFLRRHIISKVMQAEQSRLEQIIETQMAPTEKSLIDSLPVRPGDGMYPFTAIQKEPSSFDYYRIRRLLDRQKILRPIYKVALRLCDRMDISNGNIRYYSTLATEYKVFDLKRLQSNLSYPYLLCSAYDRYRWANDILTDALRFYVSGLEKSAEKEAEKQLYDHQMEATESLSRVPKVPALFKDTSNDDVLFGEIKKKAFSWLSPEGFDLAINIIYRTRPDKKEIKWLYYQMNKRLISLYLRPICFFLQFGSNQKSDPSMQAINSIKNYVETEKKSLTKVPVEKLNLDFLSDRRKKYIYDRKGDFQPSGYEPALYQELKNRLESGDVFLPHSFVNKNFDRDLIDKNEWIKNKPDIIERSGAPKIQRTARQVLDEWQEIIEPLYKRVNDRIKKGANPSVRVDGEHKDGTAKWHLAYTGTSNPLNHKIYRQFRPIDIAALLQLVDGHTDFQSAFTHLLGSNVRRSTDKQQLIACPVAFGTNYGIGGMAGISDMSYRDLMTTAGSLIHLKALKEANRRIADRTGTLRMYRHYHLRPDVVHSSSDGQKYYTQVPTIISRHSSKYFGLAKGISSLTNVADHIPISAEIIGANEHESHYVFDLLFNNDTDIRPNIHSTDSAGINQVNFAILDMFGYRFAPRYKDISSKSKTIYSFRHPGKYADCPLRPKRQILTGLIMDEWDNFQRITASLAMKTTTQSTIIKKLSSHKRNDRTIRAIAEYNNIVETRHKLHFIDGPDFQKQVQTVLNRGEHVNKLRKHLFHANGGKFKVHTVMEQKIWSECNRLLTNAIIYYNTWLLTELLDFHEQKGNIIEADLIKKVSPIAWQHIHIHGRYTFKIDKVDLDILSIIKNVKI